MKIIITLLLIATLALCSLAQQAQQNRGAQTTPTPAPSLSSALCGKATFLFISRGQLIGNETFEVKCAQSGGFNGSSHLVMKLPMGGNIDLNTTVELDRTGLPLKFTAKGISVNQTLDQSIAFNNGTATVSNNNASSQIAYTNGAAFLMPGIINYLFNFVAARYDNARGGAQRIVMFPDLSATIERVAHDEVRAIGIAATTKLTGFDRYTVKFGIATLLFWTDEQGRVAV
ncbi:MAG TPA: hypothetical protein VK619_11440, partial [Pyrinomonadaceae bacterium]|nr:hypothetical protein [Pyrinomonadaceae bacterium]